jgi:hypothetical protein
MRFMKRPRPTGVAGFFLAALLVSSAWASVSPPPQPGTLNYIEGRAFEGGQPFNGNSVGIIELTAGESLSTEEGKVEILLTPGIFFRLDDRSSMRMISPGLADTVLQLQNGRAMVDVASILPENNVRINECGASTQLLKVGLYDFDASRGLIRVFDGKALVQAGSKQIEVGGGHQLDLNMIGKLKTRRFDKNTYTDDFYRWSSLRSSYLAEANVDAARNYAGGGLIPAGNWCGSGWYWNQGFDAYTFIPGDGVYYDPFGWGFLFAVARLRCALLGLRMGPLRIRWLRIRPLWIRCLWPSPLRTRLPSAIWSPGSRLATWRARTHFRCRRWSIWRRAQPRRRFRWWIQRWRIPRRWWVWRRTPLDE